VDASRGAPLRVATVTSSSITGEGGATVEVKGVVVDKALFDSPSGGPTKVQVQMMREWGEALRQQQIIIHLFN